jgi:hypothetical protein
MQSFAPIIRQNLIDDMCIFLLRRGFLAGILLNIDPIVQIVSAFRLSIDALCSPAIPANKVALFNVVVLLEFGDPLLVSVFRGAILLYVVDLFGSYQLSDV